MSRESDRQANRQGEQIPPLEGECAKESLGDKALAFGSNEVAAEPTTDNAAEDARKRVRYTLRPVIKPLAAQTTEQAPGVRAESEDDDGYDPYSDIHDGTAAPLEFDADPWR